MPLSRLPEMAEVAIAMFSPDLEGPQREPPPRRMIFANLMDHMACEGLLESLPRMLREMSASEAARNEVVEVLHRVATAMERTAELLRTHMKGTCTFFCLCPQNAILGINVSTIRLYAYRKLQCLQHRILFMCD